MSAPFTTEQFFDVFTSYNAAIWPAQLAAYFLGLAVVAPLTLKRLHAPRFILSALALMWLWNGIGYHLLFFAKINTAATVFAGIFVVQALLFAGCALARRSLTFQVDRDLRSVAELAFTIYALIIYPAFGCWAGHGFTAGPMFGVAPCPTTIFTIGLLVLARGRLVYLLSIVPFLWSLVGLAAALQLGMLEDLALPIASIVLAVVLATDFRRRRTGTGAATPPPGSAAV